MSLLVALLSLESGPARATPASCADIAAPTDLASWAAAFSTPRPSDYPHPQLTLGSELSGADMGADLDRLKAAGFCTVVVIPSLGPSYGTDPSDLRYSLQGSFWSQMQSVLDEAAARGMRIWFETFQKTDIENKVLEDHPEFVGQTLSESSRGQQYNVNNTAYDRLDPDATDALIDAFYGEFEARFPTHFGTTLVGFWDDESRLLSSGASDSNLPWSQSLPAQFSAAKGYTLDLTTPALLEHLFHNGSAQARQVRTDYWDVVSKAFGQNHFGRIQSWLAARNVKFVVQPYGDEGQPTNDSSRVAEDMMNQGSVFTQFAGGIPGSDMLRNDDDQGGIGSNNYGMVLKQTSSAMHLFGSSDAQHEPFGHSQQSLPLMRYYTDRMIARGITLIQPGFYIQRDPKTGAVSETVLNDQYLGNVQWPYQSEWAKYAARLRALVDGGVTKADVLLVYPITSAWAANPDTSADNSRVTSYMNLGTALIDGHRDFDATPEDVIVDSSTTLSGGRFLRNGRSYSTVVLPAAEALRSTTATRLKDFVDQGGHVIAVDRMPSIAADGQDSTLTTALTSIFGVAPSSTVPAGVNQHVVSGGGSGIRVGAGLHTTTDLGVDTRPKYQVFWDALDLTGDVDATLTPERLNTTFGYVIQRDVGNTNKGHTANEVLHFTRFGQDAYFVTNYPDGHERFVTDANTTALNETAHDTVLKVPVTSGVPQIWDPETGTTGDAPVWWRDATSTHVELHLSPQGGKAVVFRSGTDPCHVTQAGLGVTNVTSSSGTVQVDVRWSAAPRTESIPVTCATGTATVSMSNTTSLAGVQVPGPFSFSFRQFRPPTTVFTPTTGEVPLGVRGPGSWTRPDPTGAPPLIGVSGTGVYKTLSTNPAIGALDLPSSYFAPGVRIVLDLGRVRDVSSVKVNGTNVGRRPWPGHIYDITTAAHAGLNTLEIAVTNAAANGAVGFQASPLRDSGLLSTPTVSALLDISAGASIASFSSSTAVGAAMGRRGATHASGRVPH